MTKPRSLEPVLHLFWPDAVGLLHNLLYTISQQIKTSDLLTQTETRNSRGACLKHSKTKSKSFTRRRKAPDDPRL